MKAFVLAFTSALIIESLIFYSLGIWLCSPQTPIRPIVKLHLSSIQLPIKKKITKKIQKIIKPQLAKQTPTITKVPKVSPVKKTTVKPKTILKKIIKLKKILPKKSLPKKTIVVKNKQHKAIKRKKEFNPYKNIIKQKPIVISKEKVRIANHFPDKKQKILNEKVSLPTQNNNNDAIENKLYLSKVSRILSRRKKYPRLAKKRGIEGQILIAFKIDARGKTSDINVLKGKNTILLKAAKRLVKNCSLPVPPKSWISKTIIKLPINYKLRN